MGTDTAPNVRVISAVSRFDDVPPELYIELTAEGYRALGSSWDVARLKARETLLSTLPTSEGNALPLVDLVAEGIGKTTTREVAEELVSEGLVGSTGAGVKGDPYRYWRKEIRSSAYRNEVPEERNRDEPPGDEPAVEMLSSGTSTLYAEERNEDVGRV